MWVKVLGTVCAAVFVGAAVVEYKRIHVRKKKSASPNADASETAAPEVATDEEGCGELQPQ